MSIKSDSGVVQARKSLSKLGKFDVKTKRNWCSESQLEDGGHWGSLGGRSVASLPRPQLEGPAGELNTMGSIKEVNESDISEANSPNTTPRLKEQRLVHKTSNF